MNRFLFTILVLMIALIAAGSSLGAEITLPQKVTTSLNHEYDPSISPDGKLLAYTVLSQGDENIWVLNLETREKKQVTFHTSSDYSPCFAGNSELLFVSRRKNGLGEIYIADIKNGKTERLYGGNGPFDDPAVSYDGRRQAYVKTENIENASILIIDQGKIINGPDGYSPSFSKSGDTLIYAAFGDGVQSNWLGLFDLHDSSAVYFDTGPGIVSGPVFLNDGLTILFEKISNDTNGDGELTLSDSSELWKMDISTGMSPSRFYPGYAFSNPVVSKRGNVFVESKDGFIYSILVDGITNKQISADKQISLCDSLIRYAIGGGDSLVAAQACLEGYYYYPDKCRKLLLLSALLYSAMGRADIGLDNLSNGKINADPEFMDKIMLREAEIIFYYGEIKYSARAMQKALGICNEIMYNNESSEGDIQSAYEFCARLYFYKKMYNEGNSLIGEGMTRYYNDKHFIAGLEKWSLKYTAAKYPGDKGSLVPLYIDYLEKYELYTLLYDGAISDLIDLLSGQETEAALADLEDLRNNYSRHPLVSSSASMKQADILYKSGMNSLAEWRLKEIVGKYDEIPELRFQAFEKLADIYRASGEKEKAIAAIDSANLYIEYIDEYNRSVTFNRKAAEYYSFLGFDELETNPGAAKQYYLSALSYDIENYNAIWGLAKALFVMADEKDTGDYISIIGPGEQLIYLSSMRLILKYEESGNAKYLKKARGILLELIDKYPAYPLSYLSVGYANCILESYSDEPLGLYEETIEESLIGLSLLKAKSQLHARYYINIAEAYFGLRQYEEAFKYYMLANDNNETLGNNDKYLIKYGESAFESDSLLIAKECFQKLLKKASDSGDNKTKAFCAIKLGMIEQLEGDLYSAADNYEKARIYYSSRNDYKTVSDILKSQSFCFKVSGDNEAASNSANEALGLLEKTDIDKGLYDYRVKLSIWPFGIDVPLIELLPMRYGGSIYPKGFTPAGNEAFIMEMSANKNDKLSQIEMEQKKIDIFKDEEENSIDFLARLGNIYYKIGYYDSAAVFFQKAYKLSIKLEDYHGAYIELLNWAASISNGNLTAGEEQIKELKSSALDLYEYILPAYPNARANLKNMAGLAEYQLALIERYEENITDTYGFNKWLSDLNSKAGNVEDKLYKAKYYFKDALFELAPGEYPVIEANLLLNSALVSSLLGNYDDVYSLIRNAERLAVSSESQLLYARMIGLKALMGMADRASTMKMLRQVAAIYEKLPPDRIPIAEIPFIERLYAAIIEKSIQDNKIKEGLYYLEAMKKIVNAAKANRFKNSFYQSGLFKANMNRLNQLKGEIAGLKSKKRRLESMGAAGSIELKKVEAEILTKRGIYLNIKSAAKALDPMAYSSLVFDISSINSLLSNIGTGELFIAPYRIGDSVVVWFGIKNSVFLTAYIDVEELANCDLPGMVQNADVVTLVSFDKSSDNVEAWIQNHYGNIRIRKSYSLNDIYNPAPDEMKQMKNVLILKADGSSVDNEGAGEISAEIMNIDKVSNNADLRGYGWIVIDGAINIDNDNILLSKWESGIKTKSALYLKDITRIKNNAFGFILTNMPENITKQDLALVINIFNNAGAHAVIIVNENGNDDRTTQSLKLFFENIESLSPLDAYSAAFYFAAGKQYLQGNISSSYYGATGWSIKDEKMYAGKLFNEFVVMGNQSELLRKWDEAAAYYGKSLKIAKSGDINIGYQADVVLKVLKAHRHLETYNEEVERGYSNYMNIFDAVNDTLSAARLSINMAEIKLNNFEYNDVLEYAAKGIELAGHTGDLNFLASGNFIRGKAYFIRGENEFAKSDFIRAINIYTDLGDQTEAAKVWLNLAELYNNSGNYYFGARALISAQSLMGPNAKDRIQSEYLYQRAFLLSKNFRNEEAKEVLREVPDAQKNDPRIAVLMGGIYLAQGLLDSALTYSLAGLQSASSNRDNYMLTKVYELLGDTYRIDNRHEEALVQYQLALEYFRNNDIPAYPAILSYKAALASGDNNLPDDSLFIKIAKQSSSEFIKSLCIYQMGRASREKGDKEKAEAYFMEVLNSADSYTKRYLKWRAYYNLGVINEKHSYLASADSISANYPPEPDFIEALYGLNESKSDLYERMSEFAVIDGDISAAADYKEQAFAAIVSGRHFSMGVFDSIETDLLDSLNYGSHDSANYKISINEKNIYDNKRYKTLWGRPSNTGEIKNKLNEDECVIRFYQHENALSASYIDKDSLILYDYPIDIEDLEYALAQFENKLKNQVASDSILEKWYAELISPFEGLIEQKEKILIVPDGLLLFFPLESLKVPEGDYFSETYSLWRRSYLPTEFPKGDARIMIPSLELEQTYNSDLELIQYIADPLSETFEAASRAVRFMSGEFSFFEKSSDTGNNGVLCAVKPFERENYLNLTLRIILSQRDGFDGFVYGLWNSTNEAKSSYYWIFLQDMTKGNGARKSHNNAKSYLFGHFDGLPYYWSGNIYVGLN